MKKYFMLLTGILFIALSAFAITVPKAVKDAFEKRFPTATGVKWEKENAKEYEAGFKLNAVNMSANFTADGSWLETEMEIAVTDLPVAVSSAINKKYAGCSITGADKIENSKGEVFYEADIKTGKRKKEVLYKPDGTSVK
jgi:hypothetical protein